MESEKKNSTFNYQDIYPALPNHLACCINISISTRLVARGLNIYKLIQISQLTCKLRPKPENEDLIDVLIRVQKDPKLRNNPH